ncbi:MAG: response regulator transcription factor [Chloroflexi bacterium]|nr:MAG: response regulator transcription factor [Chloroflexota bacterium]
MQRRRATATLCEERNNTVSVRIGPEVQGVPFLATGHDGAPSPPGVDLAEPDASVAAGLEHLTARQIEVLRLVARGMTNNEIAETLFLSRRTVHAHLRSIFHKLGVGHRSAATRYAVQHGLL